MSRLRTMQTSDANKLYPIPLSYLPLHKIVIDIDTGTITTI